jgi:4-carboxymuconolactone decarboxylase
MDRPLRYPPLDYDKLTGLQKEAADGVMKFSLNGIRSGPFAMFLRSPEATMPVLELSHYVRFQSAISDPLAELAILIHARIWSDQYEWWAHESRGQKVGLKQEIIDAVRDGRRPTGMSAEEAALFNYSVELERDRKVSDATFAQARDVLGERAVVDLTVLLGQYGMVSLVIAASEVRLPEGAKPGLPAMVAPFAK